MKILSLSGFVPEQICDTVRFTGYKGRQIISHYCGYAADYISQVLDDADIDGAVFPRSCDSCRIISYHLPADKFLQQLVIPARQDTNAVEFFAAQIKTYKQAAESYYGTIFSDVTERAIIINERNRKLTALYENISEFSYVDWISGIHKLLIQPLNAQKIIEPSTMNNTSPSKKNVFVIGSFLTNTDVIKAIENAGLNIAGDYLPESKRLIAAPPVSKNGGIYHNIAMSILMNTPSPTQNNFKDILAGNLLEIKRKAVKGVIFITQKYCEPYDYLFVNYKQMLDENNVPVLRLVLSNSVDSLKMELAIESFADII